MLQQFCGKHNFQERHTRIKHTKPIRDGVVRVRKSTRKDFKASHRGDLERGTQGLMVNALVPTGEEGRSKLRKASGSCKRAKNRGYPNGVT